MNNPLKIQRTALLHLLAQLYRIATKYPISLTAEESKCITQIRELLKHEGFL